MEESTEIFSDNEDIEVSAPSEQDNEQATGKTDAVQDIFTSAPSPESPESDPFSESGEQSGNTDETQNSPSLTEQEKEDLKNEIQEELNIDTEVSEEESTTHSIDDIYSLLSDYIDKQDAYQTEIKEYQELYAEQSKNILSAISVVILILGFASGIILSRVVWRRI